MVKISTAFLILILFIFPVHFNQAWSKYLTVDVDRTQAETGDILTLKVKASFQALHEQPDFNILKDQFDILGTQRSNLIEIVNGQHVFTTQWIAKIISKKPGKKLIPSFEVKGIKSQPKNIFIAKSVFDDKNKVKKPTGPSFIKVSVNKTEAKVQEEIIYTLRFFYIGSLISGNLRPPLFDSSLVKELNNQVSYRKKIHGQTYDVFEWTYAFYPQKSGEMVISGQEFSGRIQLSGQLFRIQDASESITIMVHPRPADFPTHQTWLPAEYLSLEDNWQINAQKQHKIHVGDSLTRTLTLTAHGQLASQLPKLTFNNQTGIQIYPDATQTHQKITTSGVISQKIYKMALIPTEAGDVTLPEIKINWWNTQINQIEVLILPEKTLNILPALIQDPLDSASKNKEKIIIEQDNETMHVAFRAEEKNYFWMISTAIFAILWLVTLLLFFKKTPKPVKNTPSLKSNKKMVSDFYELCQQPSSAKIFYVALQKELNKHPFLTENEPLMALKSSLKAHLFNAEVLEDNTMKDICQAVKKSHEKHKESKPTKAQLQNLYPN